MKTHALNILKIILKALVILTVAYTYLINILIGQYPGGYYESEPGFEIVAMAFLLGGAIPFFTFFCLARFLFPAQRTFTILLPVLAVLCLVAWGLMKQLVLERMSATYGFGGVDWFTLLAQPAGILAAALAIHLIDRRRRGIAETPAA
jgi:hypothetical protein